MDRRNFLWAGGCALIAAGSTARALAAANGPGFPGAASLRDAAVAAERAVGGRLGVAIIDTATGARFAYRGDERFPLCSTFKLLLVGAILYRIDHGQDRPTAAR